ncbi:MAG TPA: SDR family NAD(P)-dependent oxidoreductase [Steroidobacteraceae bacterium]
MAASSNRFASLNARFPRKRAFITGAGAGLGYALARALANDGWMLGLFDRNVERLAAVEADFARAGVPALAYPGDVTHSDELIVAVNSFAAKYDGLDVMINNAGVAVAGGLMEAPLEDWRWIMDTNVMGVVHGCRAALPHLQRNGSGLIVNISSAAAFVSAPAMAPYNATKAAVLSLSETLAAELRGSGTRVCCAMPMFFESSLLESYRGPPHSRAAAAELMKRSRHSADEIAHAILDQAGRGRTYIVIPGHARTLWRLKRWLPKRFLNRMAAMYERRARP